MPGVIAPISGFYDATNVLVGSAVAFFAPVGTTDPVDSITVFDAAAWISPWASLGATEAGWQVNFNPQTTDIDIDEQPSPVGQQVTAESIQFVANLSEDSLQSLGIGLNATATVQSPTTTLFGKTTLKPQPVLLQYKVALETQNKGSFPRRYIIDAMTCAGNVGINFVRASKQRLIPVTFSSVCPISGIKIADITANHS